MKNSFKQIAITLLVLFSLSNNLKASHISSAHIYYNYLGSTSGSAPQDSFEVRLELYRDCTGVGLGTSDVMSAYSPSGCSPNISFNVTLLPGSGAQISSNLCPNVTTLCTDPNSPFNGYEEYVYTGIVVLPARCNDWTFEWSSCCRNSAISNLDNPSGEGLCIKAMVNTVARFNNTSFRYTKSPIPYVCVNQPQAYLNIPQDPTNGLGSDSIYSLNVVPISDNCVSPVVYGTIPGSIPTTSFTLNNPIQTAPTNPYIVNSSTATATFQPLVSGAYALKFRTNEYDRLTKVLIGYVERDIQLNVVNCTGSLPNVPITSNGTFNSEIDTMAGGVFVDSTTIAVCPGSNLIFGVKGKTSSINPIYVNAPYGVNSLPGATYTTIPSTQPADSFKVRVSWTPTGNDIGDHLVFIRFYDSVCNSASPIVLEKFVALVIKVNPGVDAGPDLNYCGQTSDTVTIHGTGPSGITVWDWKTLAGAIPTDVAPLGSPTIKAWPSTSTTYVLSTNATTGCKTSDTVTVFLHQPIVVDAGSDKTICANQSVQLTPSVSAPYDSLNWTPGNYFLSDSSILSPMAFPSFTTQYTLKIVDTNGCKYSDKVSVIVNGIAPLVTAWADEDTICPNGTVGLHALAAAQNCGLAQATCTGNSGSGTLNNGINGNGAFIHPFNPRAFSGRYQFVLTKAELNSMGLVGPNYVTSLSYKVINKGSQNLPLRNLRVLMSCVNRSDFSTGGVTFDPNLVDQVYYKDTLYTVTGDNLLNFDIPYFWDGESNLMVGVCMNGSGQAAAADNIQLLTSGTGAAMMMYRFVPGSSSTLPADACALAAQGANNQRPKITLGYCADIGFNLSWTPSTFLDNPTSHNPIASNVSSSPMSWTVTVKSNSNPNCSTSKTVSVYHDNSSSIDVRAYSPQYDGGNWHRDSIVLCENPSVYYLQMDTQFAIKSYNCKPINSICPSTLSYTLAPSTLNVNSYLYTPLSPAYKGRRTQYLIRASELNLTGLSQGEITKIAWNVVSLNSSAPYKDFSIKMACTSDTELINMVDNSYFSTVYSAGTGGYAPSLGWNTFDLQSHYGWDGTSNIILEVCYWNGSGGVSYPVTTNDILQYSNYQYTCAQSRLSSLTNASAVCDHLSPNFTSLDNQIRPNFQFSVCQGVQPTYYWTPGNFINDTSKISTFGIGVNTEYIYGYATGRNGCLLKDSLKLVVPIHNYKVTPLDTFICSTDQTVFNAAAGEQAYQYIWSPADNIISDSRIAAPVFTPSKGGTYPYQIIWRDRYGCEDTGNVVLNVWDTPVIVLIPLIDTVKYGNSINMSVSGALQYSWSPIQYLNNPFSNIVVATPTEPYTNFKVVGIDENGCKGTGYSDIYVDFDNYLFVPNAFTPNNDNKNDVFEIVNLKYQKIQLFQVWDRFGEKVYDATESGNLYWDGKYKGREVAADTYMYNIRVAFPNGKVQTFKGDVILIR